MPTPEFTLEQLQSFIVKAKAATYIGDGRPSLSHRPHSHDLEFRDGDFAYLDSYYGGSDFLGQEVVYYREQPVWAMNYYGYLLMPDKIRADEAGQILKKSLSKLYQEGRFLGGFEYPVDELYLYIDENDGNVAHFTGKEWILKNFERVYELVYHGGLIH